jgi:peptide/nickel transport system substrate-binding protein
MRNGGQQEEEKRFGRRSLDRRSFLRVTGTAGVASTTSMLAGCAGRSEPNVESEQVDDQQENTPAKPQNGGTLRVALQSDPWTLHPHLFQDTSSSQLAENYGNTLVDVDPEGKFLPDLATKVPKPENGGRKYVFQLRKGVRFHGDYGEVKADDVVVNFQKILDEKYGSPARADYEGILVGEGIDPKQSVQATGEYEVTFNLAEPYSPLLYKLSDPRTTIVPPEVIEKHGKDLGTPDVGIWATGPYQFVEASPNSQYTFERNPNYFKKEDGRQLPYLDRVVYRIVPESSVTATQIRTGGIHIAEYLEARDVSSVKQSGDVSVNSRPGASQINLYVNQTTFPSLSKKEVRQALALASNKQAIIQTKFDGLASPGHSIFPPWHWAYDEGAVNKYEYDPERARSLLEQAGETGLRFTCQPTNQPLFVDTASILQQNLRQIGVDMEITPKEKSAAWEPVIEAWDPKKFPPKDQVGPPSNFHALLEDITYAFDADGYSYITFHTDAWLNVSYYSNEQVDTWMENARKTLDQNEQKQIYSKVQGKITEDIPQIFQVWWNVNQGYRNEVQNFRTFPTGELNLETVWLRQG